MIRKFISLVCFGFALAFGYLYYVAYFKHRDCFNELGRCFDDEAGVVYSEQSEMVCHKVPSFSAIGALLTPHSMDVNFVKTRNSQNNRENH